MEILGITNVIFPVGDLNQAKVFYEKLGFRYKFHIDGLGVVVMGIGEGRQNLVLKKENLSPVKSSPHHARLFVEVEDAHEAKGWLRLRDLVSTEPIQMPAGWIIEVSDPWGNIVGFSDHTIRPEFSSTETKKARENEVL